MKIRRREMNRTKEGVDPDGVDADPFDNEGDKF